MDRLIKTIVCLFFENIFCYLNLWHNTGGCSPVIHEGFVVLDPQCQRVKNDIDAGCVIDVLLCIFLLLVFNIPFMHSQFPRYLMHSKFFQVALFF